jgi:hypothetical protein
MIMKGRCDECGMENIEVISIKKNNKGEKTTWNSQTVYSRCFHKKLTIL